MRTSVTLAVAKFGLLMAVLGGLLVTAGIALSRQGPELVLAYNSGGSLMVTNIDQVSTYRLANVGTDIPYIEGTTARWSPDGSQIAFVGDPYGEIFIVGAECNQPAFGTCNNRVVSPMPQIDSTSGIAWSPDGQWIAFSSVGSGTWGLYVMDKEGNHVQKLTDEGNGYPIWSPDGETLMLGSSPADSDFEPYMLNFSCGSTAEVCEATIHWLQHSGRPFFSPQRSPTDDFLAYRAGSDGVIHLISTACLTPSYLCKELYASLPSPYHHHAVWSSDGRWLAFAGWDGNQDAIVVIEMSCLRLLNGCSGERTFVTGHYVWHGHVSFSPDGKFLTFAVQREPDFEIFVLDLERGTMLQFTHNNVDDYSPSFRP